MQLTFGKYEGKQIQDVPTDYLQWLANLKAKPDIQKIAKYEIARRTKNKYDPLIYGKSSLEEIVNISFKDDSIYIFTKKSTKVIPYKPYVLSNYPSEKYESKRLLGNKFYKYLTEVSLETYKNIQNSWDKRFWTPRSIEEGYMLLHGDTYFKNLTTDKISLLSFDIETTTLDANKVNAKVLLISNTYRSDTGKIEKRIFDIKSYGNEDQMISAWEDYVQEKNPDVILGHNIFSFDLPYLAGRARRDLLLGRDKEPAIFDERVSKFRKDGSQQYEYHNVKVFGREVVDTFFLSIKYDIGRQYPSYGLKALEQHLNLIDSTRTLWDFKKFPTNEWNVWSDTKWQEFKDYCRDDADSPIAIFDLMSPTFFYLNQSIPKTFQEMIGQATGGQLDSFMIRSYLQEGYSQPCTTEKEEFQGAISFGIPGNYKNVFSVDFHALYPSIIKAYELYDKQKDPNAHLLKATHYFTAKRVEYKNLYKETGDAKYDGMQLASKVVANSIYGFAGSNYLLYNSPKISATVTKIGRGLLDTICKEATGKSIYQWKKLIEKQEQENDNSDSQGE